MRCDTLFPWISATSDAQQQSLYYEEDYKTYKELFGAAINLGFHGIAYYAQEYTGPHFVTTRNCEYYNDNYPDYRHCVCENFFKQLDLNFIRAGRDAGWIAKG